MKINTTISLDSELKEEFKKILKEEKINFTFWVERCMKDVIKKRNEKGVKKNV